MHRWGKVSSIAVLGIALAGIAAQLKHKAEPAAEDSNQVAETRTSSVSTTSPPTLILQNEVGGPNRPTDAGQEDPEDLELYAEALGDELSQETAESISSRLRDAVGKHADVDFEIAKNQLLTRAKAGDRAALTALIQLAHSENPALQIRAAHILGEVATPEALSALVALASDATQQVPLRQAVLAAIADIGKWREQDQSPLLMSKLLLDYLNSLPSQDTVALTSASRGLVGLGEPNGVERVFQLIDSLSAGDENAAKTRQQLTLALGGVRSPSAIPLLAGYLNADATGLSERVRLAGSALSAMGQAQATSALLDWAATANTADAANLAERWLGAVRDPKSLQLLLNVDQRTDFKDPGLRTRLHELGLKLERQATPK